MWKKSDSAQIATDDNIMWLKRIACRIIEATHTFRIYNTYCFSIATMVTRMHLDVMFVSALPLLLVY